MSSRLTLAVHILGWIAWCESRRCAPATSEEVAQSVDTNAVVVRRLIGDLRRAGLVETRRGAGGGMRLRRGPEAITVRDVYEAVADDEALLALHPSPPNACCTVGAHIGACLREVYGRAEEALKAELAQVTIADVHRAVMQRHAACRGGARPGPAAESHADQSDAGTAP